MQPISPIQSKSVGPTHSPGSSIPTDGIFDAAPLSTILLTTVDSPVEVTGSLSPLEGFGIADEDQASGIAATDRSYPGDTVKCLKFTQVDIPATNEAESTDLLHPILVSKPPHPIQPRS